MTEVLRTPFHPTGARIHYLQIMTVHFKVTEAPSLTTGQISDLNHLIKLSLSKSRPNYQDSLNASAIIIPNLLHDHRAASNISTPSPQTSRARCTTSIVTEIQSHQDSNPVLTSISNLLFCVQLSNHHANWATVTA